MVAPPSDPSRPQPDSQPLPGRTVAFWVGVGISCLYIAFAGFAAALPLWMADLIVGLILSLRPRPMWVGSVLFGLQPRIRNLGGGFLIGPIPGFFLSKAIFVGVKGHSFFMWTLFAGSLLIIAVSSTRIKPPDEDPPSEDSPNED